MRSLVLTATLVASLTHAQPTPGPALSGMRTPINNGPGDQTDPHLSPSTVAYTHQSGGSEIRYHVFDTGADAAIPNGGAFDALSDVSDSWIVFTRVTPGKSAVYLYNSASPSTPIELAPSPTSNRRAASIGARTVAWQDLGFSSNVFETEIVVHELDTSATVRLTQDNAFDLDPSVSVDGSVVTWTRCDTSGLQCDIRLAQRLSGVWTVRSVTGVEGEEGRSNSDGTWVVYASMRSGERDIYWQPVAGGAEARLSLPGEQTNPHLAGDLIAFETRSSASDDWDVALYDRASNTYYLVTDSPMDETLSDLSRTANGQVRVVWSVVEQDANVYAFTFRLQDACDDASSQPVCDAPGDRPLLLDAVVRGRDDEPSCDCCDGEAAHHRKHKHHKHSRPHKHSGGCHCAERTKRSEDADEALYKDVFLSAPGTGLLCLDNQRAPSGTVALNGIQVWGPNDLQVATTKLESKVPLTDRNALSATLSGDAGVSYRLRVYGPEPRCVTGETPSMPPSADGGTEGSGHSPRGGCATGGNDMAFAALFAGLLFAAWARRSV